MESTTIQSQSQNQNQNQNQNQSQSPSPAGRGARPRGGILTHALRKVYAPSGRRSTAPARGAAESGAAAPEGIVALEALDLEIHPGELFGLLGPNGAGKTTTLGILTTRVRATAGEATVFGADVRRDPVAVRSRIGVVPQRPNADRSLTVIENLVFHARYFGIARGEALERARRLLGRLGIGDRGAARVDHLSGGQQQRLMIARALMHEPPALFMDEPTVGLDPQARMLLWDILRDLKAQGHTIVLTTHYMEEAERLCDRLAIIDRGRLLALDTPADLTARAPGGTRVELTFDREAPAPGEIAALGADGIRDLEVKGHSVCGYAERPGEAIAALVRAAERSGRVVTHVHLAPPSLETLFVSHTGRSFE